MHLGSIRPTASSHVLSQHMLDLKSVHGNAINWDPMVSMGMGGNWDIDIIPALAAHLYSSYTCCICQAKFRH